MNVPCSHTLVTLSAHETSSLAFQNFKLGTKARAPKQNPSSLLTQQVKAYPRGMYRHFNFLLNAAVMAIDHCKQESHESR